MMFDGPLCLPSTMAVTKYVYVTPGCVLVSLNLLGGSACVVEKILIGRLDGVIGPVAFHT